MQFNLSKASDGILLVDATKKAGEFLKLDKVYEATSPDLRVKLANVHRCLVPLRLMASGPISSGTYIRSLGQDIGEKLGTGAYCTRLRRTRIADWSIDEAKQLLDFGIKN